MHLGVLSNRRADNYIWEWLGRNWIFHDPSWIAISHFWSTWGFWDYREHSSESFAKAAFSVWDPAPSLTCSFARHHSSGAKPGCTGNFRAWVSTYFIHVLQRVPFTFSDCVPDRSTWCQQLSELLSFLFILRPGKGTEHCSVKLPVFLTVTWKNYGMKKFSPESWGSAPGPS